MELHNGSDVTEQLDACVAIGEVVYERCRLIMLLHVHCVCAGVFVLVTMAISTVSVMESVTVIRLCSPQLTVKPLPPVVRLVAFRLGRLLCVSCPSTKPNTGPSRVRPTVTVDDSDSSPDVQRDGADGMTADVTVKPRTSVVELPKVNSLQLHRRNNFTTLAEPQWRGEGSGVRTSPLLENMGLVIFQIRNSEGGIVDELFW